MDPPTFPELARRYFKFAGEHPRGWRNLFRLGSAKRFLVWQSDGRHQTVTFSELFDYLDVSAKTGARRDVYFCVDQARQIQEVGDSESWIEFPTGRTIQDPDGGAAP